MSILGAAVVPHPPIILPEIGGGEEQKISSTSTAYSEVAKRIVNLEPETIIITSPHTIMYADYFHISPNESASGNMAQFKVPQVSIDVNYDVMLAKKISEVASLEKIPAGTFGEKNPALDHGTMIPLRFLQLAGLDFNRVKFLRIGLSGLSATEHYKFGQTIARAADELGRKIFFLASGDLSHKLKADGPYGFVEEGPKFDAQIMNILGEADFLKLLTMDNTLCSRAAECGLRSFWIMSGALDKKNIHAEKFSYEGPFGVGYGIVWFDVGDKDEARNFGEQLLKIKEDASKIRKSNEDIYVKLARHSLENFVKTHKPANIPLDLPDELTKRRAGAFVSLHKDGKLRGCIGTIGATRDNLAEEIFHNAIAACSNDPRFSPVAIEELDALEYSVDVLSEPERIFKTKDLDVKRYGVIVANGSCRGLLLPDIEGINTVEEQIAVAKRKAGLKPEDNVAMWRFEVVRHH